MARPLRLEFPGALYHLTSRGNARADIFRDDVDCQVFLRVVAATVKAHGWLVYAYCLMGNHYHLLAETPQPNLSRAMRQLNGTYTQYFNRRHVRVGHLFQGRFKAILVERETYWLELTRYIALNPVAAGLVDSAAAWQWSSYRAYTGRETAPAWLSVGPVLERFGQDPKRAAERYAQFVHAGIGAGSPWSRLRGQIVLGSEQFARRVLPDTECCTATEIPREQRLAARPALETLLNTTTVADRAARNAAIAQAHHAYGYTFAEIARHTGLHYSTVSRIAQADAAIQDLTPA